MKKILALLLASCFLLLAACGERTPTSPEDNTITTTPMPPLQGGPMLYSFFGSEPYKMEISEYDGREYPVYPIGLVNQEGELVTAPVYVAADYIYDEEGFVIGLIATQDRAFTLYQLDGTSRSLTAEGFAIDVYPGGRYATVRAADDGSPGYYCASEILMDGIYDIENGRFAVEPKLGQMIQYRRGGLAMGYQYDSEDGMGNEIAQWAFHCADENVRELPLELGRVQEYYPETGWFGAMLNWEHRYYDNELNPLPGLTGWSACWEGFNSGEYLVLYNNNDFPGVSTVVNRAGEVLHEEFQNAWRRGNLFLALDYANEHQPSHLYGADLNLIAEAGDGSIVVFDTYITHRAEVFLLLDADGNVKEAYGEHGEALPASPVFRGWGQDDMAFGVLNGEWRSLDVNQFAPENGFANIVLINEDLIVINTFLGSAGHAALDEAFAIGWDGNLIESSPLEPFYHSLAFMGSAGEQGPDYFWVETETQRGFINAKGEWLFIDK